MDEDTIAAHRLGALLTANQEPILARWRTQVLAEIPGGAPRRMPEPILFDHIPVVLSQLAAFFVHFPAPIEAAVNPYHGEAYEHVTPRREAGYRVADLITKIILLRAEIYRVLEAAGASLSPRLGMLLNGILDDLMLSVTGEFDDQQKAIEGGLAAAMRRLSVLDGIATAALRANTLEELFDAVLREIKPALGVDAVTILLPVPGTHELQVRASVGLEYPGHESARVPVGAGFAGKVFATARPLRVDLASGAEMFNPALRERMRALLGVPLRYERRVLGVLHVATRGSREFTDADEVFLQLMSDRIAVAVAHAEIRAAESSARARADEERNRMRRLYETSAELISVVEFPAVLRKVAERSLETLGDWCLIDLLEGATLHSVAGAHRDPAKRHWLTVLQHYAPFGGVRRNVIRTQTPYLARDVTEEKLREIAADEDHFQALRNLGTHSFIVVPLVARGEAFGTLSFGRNQARNFNEDDLSLAAEIGRQTGLALDNSVLVENLRAALRGREEILAVVSHDLRNPLSTILLSAETAQRMNKGVQSKAVFKHLDLIRRAGERMDRLIGDLLDFSRLTEHQLSVERRAEPAADILHEAVQLSKGVAAGRARLIEVAETLDGTLVDADRGRVIQVLSNLITNAVRFSPPDAEIEVEAHPVEGGVVFSVRDQGPGVPPEESEHIFEPFRQGHNAAREGVGLGLAIAKGIVEAHGGQIWVEPAQAERGAVFAFTLRAPSVH